VLQKLTLLTYGRAEVIRIFLCPSFGNILPSAPIAGQIFGSPPNQKLIVLDVVAVSNN